MLGFLLKFRVLRPEYLLWVYMSSISLKKEKEEEMVNARSRLKHFIQRFLICSHEL